MADVWIRQYKIKTDKLSRDLYYYQDGIYVDADDFIGGLIDEKFRGLNTTTFINNTLEYIRRHSLYEFTDEWLAVDNGLINPTTMELIGFSPERVTRIKLNVAYDPAAKWPAWGKFQEECKADTTVLQELSPRKGRYAGREWRPGEVSVDDCYKLYIGNGERVPCGPSEFIR